MDIEDLTPTELANARIRYSSLADTPEDIDALIKVALLDQSLQFTNTEEVSL